MKTFRYLFVVLAVMYCLLLDSCAPNYSYSSSGLVYATPSTAQIGDTVQLNFILGTTITFDDENAIQKVSYYIGENKIAESKDAKNHFNVAYKVENLGVGTYEITAQYTPLKNWQIEVDLSIIPCTLTITE